MMENNITKKPMENNKTIYLHTNGNNGILPNIQDKSYWQDSYKYVAFETFDAITLSKQNVKLNWHPCYDENVIKNLK